MLKKSLLMVPGPTPVPEKVLQAMNRPMINHRGPEYEVLFRGISENLKRVFKTKGDVLTYPSAGTGAMEAAVVNFLSPGDKILVVSIGVFGDRFAEIAKEFNVNVEKLDFPWGTAACSEKLVSRLQEDKDHAIKAVYITHNETSTGVTNDIKALAAARGNHPALIVVDAVSSLAAINLEMEAWDIDVVITGAQKAFMIPPGLGFMAMNDRAWAAYEKSTLPKYYWDAKRVKKSLDKGQNPYTPPVSLLFGLEESLRMMFEEGLDNIYARHRLLADSVRAGIRALGLELLTEDRVASPVVTAVKAPEGFEAKRIQKYMRDAYGVTIAGGQKMLENKIFRIGHLGYVAPADVLTTMTLLEMTMNHLGLKVECGTGVAAAQKVFLAENV